MGDKPRILGGFGDINYGTQYRQGNRVYDSRSVAMAVTASPPGNLGGYTYLYLVVNEMNGTVTKGGKTYAIRKLTPKECWRLMGFSDDDFHKAEAVNSNTQLYKQAGNSIVKDVLMAIFRQMLEVEDWMT